MTFEIAQKLLEDNKQSHVLKFWDTLDDAARAALLEQIAAIDFASVRRMQKAFCTAPDVIELTDAERALAREAGEKKLRAGEVAVLVVAGGQGSRLGYEGPKGVYPIGPVTGNSLFYFHARQIVGLSKRYNVRVPFYIMTSEVNYAQTKEHFEANNYFGLNKDDVILFQQGVWPTLTQDGLLILDAPGHIFMSPDGHGGTIAALDKNGCLADMTKRGIASVFYFQVDNPLIEIAEPAFIGLHAMNGADISLKVCAKRAPDEGLGVVVTRDGHSEIVEYTELSEDQAQRTTDDGELYFKYGSVGIHIFALEFLKAEASRNMPLHVAHKKIPMCDESGAVVKPTENNGYKFEKFIFDVLPNAAKVVNLAFNREDEFSPVKNAYGNDSPETCKRDMQAKWRRQLAAVGIQSDGKPLELDPADYDFVTQGR